MRDIFFASKMQRMQSANSSERRKYQKLRLFLHNRQGIVITLRKEKFCFYIEGNVKFCEESKLAALSSNTCHGILCLKQRYVHFHLVESLFGQTINIFVPFVMISFEFDFQTFILPIH